MVAMTGRDLIIYILQNNLEDQPLFEDGKLLGFMTAIEAAIKFEVGVATVLTWLNNGQLDGVTIGNEIYIPMNAKRPVEGGKDVE